VIGEKRADRSKENQNLELVTDKEDLRVRSQVSKEVLMVIFAG